VEIRQAIVGEIRNAEGLEAVRAALRKLFEAFILHAPRTISSASSVARSVVNRA
jgi:hypothetical protein